MMKTPLAAAHAARHACMHGSYTSLTLCWGVPVLLLPLPPLGSRHHGIPGQPRRLFHHWADHRGGRRVQRHGILLAPFSRVPGTHFLQFCDSLSGGAAPVPQRTTHIVASCAEPSRTLHDARWRLRQQEAPGSALGLGPSTPPPAPARAARRRYPAKARPRCAASHRAAGQAPQHDGEGCGGRQRTDHVQVAPDA